MASRQYDIVLFGATGYTGLYTAEYITTNLRTDLNWAVAGRSHQKLSNVVQDLKKLNSNRRQPEIEVAQLQKDELHAIAKKTKILINTVGPYTLYGEPVLEACVSNGTHYLDVTGESPWVVKMIKKYDALAKSTGSIVISQIGVDSAPADLLTYALVTQLKKTTSRPAEEVVVTLHDVKGGLSGGTLSSVVAIFNEFSISETANAGKPSAMSPVPTPTPTFTPSLLSRLFGVRAVPDLGTMGPSIQRLSDLPIVYRTWGLMHKFKLNDAYGPRFTFNEYTTVRNSFTGAIGHFILTLSSLILLIPPIRWVFSRLATQPGSGPSREDSEHYHMEYRGTARPDPQSKERAFARLRYEGGAYPLTGVFAAEGAATILDNADTYAKELGGGYLTPALLGEPYIDRLRKGGLVLEVKSLSS